MSSKGVGRAMRRVKSHRAWQGIVAAALLLSASGVAPASALRTPVRGVAPLAPGSSVRAGKPLDAVVADFNGDRLLDIAEVYSDGGIGVRLGTAPDTFTEEPTLLAGTSDV